MKDKKGNEKRIKEINESGKRRKHSISKKIWAKKAVRLKRITPFHRKQS
jgi:hypothetical protein